MTESDGDRWNFAAPSTAELTSSQPASITYLSASQGQSNASGDSNRGAPRLAAPAIHASSSSGNTDLGGLVDPAQQAYIDAIMVRAGD